MQCTCGYRFYNIEGCEAYAVIRDSEYSDVMDDEITIRRSRSERGWLSAIAQGATRVGSLKVCPACARLILLKPGAESVEYYERAP